MSGILKNRQWIAFYSHTGSEIQKIVNELGIRPDAICTNNADHVLRDCYTDYIYHKTKWDSKAYRHVLNKYEKPLVTLHGWMKIVPPDICNECEIYNGHPALITEYPELKGKDKQEDVINQLEKYPIIGSVIHECTAIVDDGKVIMQSSVPNIPVHNRNLIYDILKDVSLRTWLDFLPYKLK